VEARAGPGQKLLRRQTAQNSAPCLFFVLFCFVKLDKKETGDRKIVKWA
jgi:hypothetical protein